MVDPIKGALLRRAGQGIEDEIKKVEEEVRQPAIVYLLILVSLCLYSWILYVFNWENNPYYVTAYTGIAFLWLYYLMKGSVKKIKQLDQGRRGEWAVADYLSNNVTDETCRFYNDLVFDEGFNIDHVIISTRGIFVLETKTYDKPASHAEIHVRDDGIHFPNFTGRAELDQAQRNADFFKRWLKNSFGKDIAVKGVLLFPGWFVKDHRAQKKPWVLSPKAFLTWYRNQDQCLSVDDYNLVKQAVMGFVKAREAGVAGSE